MTQKSYNCVRKDEMSWFLKTKEMIKNKSPSTYETVILFAYAKSIATKIWTTTTKFPPNF